MHRCLVLNSSEEPSFKTTAQMHSVATKLLGRGAMDVEPFGSCASSQDDVCGAQIVSVILGVRQ